MSDSTVRFSVATLSFSPLCCNSVIDLALNWTFLWFLTKEFSVPSCQCLYPVNTFTGIISASQRPAQFISQSHVHTLYNYNPSGTMH